MELIGQTISHMSEWIDQDGMYHLELLTSAGDVLSLASPKNVTITGVSRKQRRGRNKGAGA